MITNSDIEIDAPPDVVWEVFTDVEHWSDWTASVTSITALDGPAIEVGHRFRIKQPRMLPHVWEVTEVEPGATWTWVQRSAGARTFATHEVLPSAAGGTVVRQRIDQRGFLGVAVAVAMRRMTRRYLDLEARGLKAASEARVRPDASTG
jgi:uncharacterized protein YndB with AHSA1/START domain